MRPCEWFYFLVASLLASCSALGVFVDSAPVLVHGARSRLRGGLTGGTPGQHAEARRRLSSSPGSQSLLGGTNRNPQPNLLYFVARALESPFTREGIKQIMTTTAALDPTLFAGSTMLPVVVEHAKLLERRERSRRLERGDWSMIPPPPAPPR